jgi:hypothetical protein
MLPAFKIRTVSLCVGSGSLGVGSGGLGVGGLGVGGGEGTFRCMGT